MNHQHFSQPKPHWLSRFLPTPGNVIFTLLAITLAFWAQSVGALPGASTTVAPQQASTDTIAYQGRLTDAAGNPLTGTYDMAFRLYDASTGGTLLWEEQSSGGVQVSDGLFNVMLGSQTPITSSIFADYDSLFLGVVVGSEEMSGRVQLGSVPFAMQALTVADGSVTTDKIADGNVTTEKIADGNVTTDKLNIDDSLFMNYNTIRNGIIWPPSYDGRGSHSALPGFLDTLYHATKKDITVEANRGPNSGTLARMFNLHPNSYAHWNSVSSSNPVIITITYNGAPFISSVILAFGGRNNQAIDYVIEYYHDADSDGTYNWNTVANVTGNTRYEVLHPIRNWRIQKIRITVTDAGDDDHDQKLSIATIQAPSAIHGKATGHMLDIGGDKMYGTLDMNGNSIINQGAMVEANLQTPAELSAEKIARFSEGDVLCWGEDRLEHCTQAGDPLVQAVADKNGKPIVIGAEVIKVIGAVRRGDLLVASDVPGYAMVDNTPRPGSVIAQALEDFDGEKGLIKAMIRKF